MSGEMGAVLAPGGSSEPRGRDFDERAMSWEREKHYG